MSKTKEVSLAIKNQILTAISSNGGKVSARGLMRLIEVTNTIVAPTFVTLHNYSSDKSEQTELADYLINVGTKYNNAKVSTQKKISNITVHDMQEIANRCTIEIIDVYNVNTKGIAPLEYCELVKGQLLTAISEMKVVRPQKKSNDIWLNKVLVFNTNTEQLSLMGELIKGRKTVNIKAAPKARVGSSPKTIAKKVIKYYLNTRTSKIERFKVVNTNKISIKNESVNLVEV